MSETRRGLGGPDTTSPIRILLLEDSDIDAELLVGHLTKDDIACQVERVVNRRGFIDGLAPGELDIILADYSLPDFDGLSALAIARDLAPDLPFIFVSGVVGEEFATNAIKRGATDYVLKRNLSRLPTAIDRALAEARERLHRRLAENEVRHLNATLAEQIEARTRERDRIWRLSRDLFAVVGTGGAILSANPAWARLLGYEESVLSDARLQDFVHPGDCPRVDRFLTGLASGQTLEPLEVRMLHASGLERWIAWIATPDEEQIYAVGRDITEEKRSNAALGQANAELHQQIAERERAEAALAQMQRLEAVGQLTAGVAHDFNNLLTVILGNANFIERELHARAADGRAIDRLGQMRAAAERGATLTAQLLAFSRRQRLEPKAVNLNDTVAGMRSMLQATLGGSMRVETVLRPDLWLALVDPTQIEMVVLNLAINARDAMAVGGGLTVETTNVVLGESSRPEEPSAGEYVALIVSDTGAGMSEEVLAKAFEPFFTTKGPGKGSGLGLAQVYGFAKQSGGGVGIHTRLGEGTSIRVYLPRARAQGYVAPAPGRAVMEGVDAHEGTILLVDDDTAVRQVTASLLSDMGYRVIQVGSGGQALDLLRQESIDLMLADYAMPGMNGRETAAAARQLKPNLPIIFVTGYADLGALQGVGEALIIQKPFRVDELRRKVADALVAARQVSGNVVRLSRKTARPSPRA